MLTVLVRNYVMDKCRKMVLSWTDRRYLCFLWGIFFLRNLVKFDLLKLFLVLELFLNTIEVTFHKWLFTQLYLLLINLFQNHSRSLVDIGHDCDDILWLFTQFLYPPIYISCIIVWDSIGKSHRIADDKGSSLCHKFFFSIFLRTELSFWQTVKSTRMSRGVRHFVHSRGIILLSIHEDFLKFIVNVELCLHRHHNRVFLRIVNSSLCLLIHLDRTKPFLFVKHTIKSFILIHTLIILDRRELESGEDGLVFLVIILFKSGLVYVPFVENLQIGTYLTFVLLILG